MDDEDEQRTDRVEQGREPGELGVRDKLHRRDQAKSEKGHVRPSFLIRKCPSFPLVMKSRI